MEIRSWKYCDISRIAELEKECFPKEPWSFQMLASSFDSETFYGVLADDCGEIVGYGGITVAGDSADIDNVAVTEYFRNSGIGTEILQSLVNIARVEGANSVAMGLYLKCGFKGAYARTRYYSDGEDCLVMVKELG